MVIRKSGLLAVLAALATLAALVLPGCNNAFLPSPEVSGELVIATRNSPTTYFTDDEGNLSGFEYDLAARFAEKNGWKLHVVIEKDLQGLLTAARTGRVHLAAAGLTVTEERQREVAFGPVYAEVEVVVVCNARGRIPKNLKDLDGLRFEVVAKSSHEEFLKSEQRKLPNLSWQSLQVQSTEELLERVGMGLSDCTAADSDSLAVAHNFYPDLHDAFVLQKGQPQAWVMRRGVDVGFSRAISKFFREMEQSGEMAKLRERYYGHVSRLDDADVTGLLQRRQQLLPGLRPYFQEAQQETGFDWRLLAAMAYQESHWDTHAVSSTGVRGIMMLTAATADRLGVKDRLDPRESILGGARYIGMLRDELPQTIPEPDRTWMALAAYNIGMGHLNDARVLAKRMGKNPDDWRDMKSVLPSLSRSQHYATLKYGFARGGEARVFAENVRIYYDILKRYEPLETTSTSVFRFFNWKTE